MEAQRVWWNRKWGKITRRDVLIYYRPEQWLIVAREGGPEGKAKKVEAASEAEALQIAEEFRRLGGGDWRELTGPSADA